jgi:hypothetical protein
MERKNLYSERILDKAKELSQHHAATLSVTIRNRKDGKKRTYTVAEGMVSDPLEMVSDSSLILNLVLTIVCRARIPMIIKSRKMIRRRINTLPASLRKHLNPKNPKLKQNIASRTRRNG